MTTVWQAINEYHQALASVATSQQKTERNAATVKLLQIGVVLAVVFVAIFAGPGSLTRIIGWCGAALLIWGFVLLFTGRL